MLIDTEWMAENIFLHKLQGHEARIIQDHFRLRYYEAGDEIITEGRDGDALKVLYTGRVLISHEVDGQPVYLGEAEEGATFGEGTFLKGGKTNATVTAHSNCIVYELKRGDYCGLMSKDQEMVIGLLTYVLARTSSMVQKMNMKQQPNKAT